MNDVTITESLKHALDELVHLPDNKTCADCSAPDPLWASVNLGVFMCIKCAGVHRSLGSHISKVRSLELDCKVWEPEQISFMRSVGNVRAKKFWEAIVPPEVVTPTEFDFPIVRENWIRSKYEKRLFVPADGSADIYFMPTLDAFEVAQHTDWYCNPGEVSGPLPLLELMQKWMSGSITDDTFCWHQTLTDWMPAKNIPQLAELRNKMQVKPAPPSPPPRASAKVDASLRDFARDVSENGEVVKGFMDKLQETTRWQRRYFILRNALLTYYKNQADSYPAGSISVDQCTVSLVSADKGTGVCMALSLAIPERTYTFAHDDPRVTLEWAVSLRRMKNQSLLWGPSGRPLLQEGHSPSVPVQPKMTGFLTKQGGHFKTLKRRWFVLRGLHLCYFKSAEDEAVCGDIPLVDCTVEAALSRGTPKLPFCFSIITGNRNYYLWADTEADLHQWVAALQEAVRGSR
eukprot:GILK01009485.1.p1 GENE.GILK01009485.1~~GILK01009485.1.p1  ORF type:complete len:460 (+),score=63.24 GILK01009485.1:151-1530(+)